MEFRLHPVYRQRDLIRQTEREAVSQRHAGWSTSTMKSVGLAGKSEPSLTTTQARELPELQAALLAGREASCLA